MSERLAAMTTKQNPFSRSDLNEELRELLAAGRGIADAEALVLRLPLLQTHPAVVSLAPETGARVFQQGLERALGKAIELSEEPESMQRALRWHFALDKGETIENAKARHERAVELAPSESMNRYSKDRPGQQPPDITIALESVEAQLELLGQARPGRPRAQSRRLGDSRHSRPATCGQGQDATQEMALEFEEEPRDSRPDCKEWPLMKAFRAELGDEAKAQKTEVLQR